MLAGVHCESDGQAGHYLLFPASMSDDMNRQKGGKCAVFDVITKHLSLYTARDMLKSVNRQEQSSHATTLLDV